MEYINPQSTMFFHKVRCKCQAFEKENIHEKGHPQYLHDYDAEDNEPKEPK